MSREAMKLALEALEEGLDDYWRETNPLGNQAITALKQALEQTEPEPVAWRTFDGEGGYDYRDYDMNENYHKEWAERNPNHAHWVEPLYTHPPKRKPLTDEEIADLWSAQIFHIVDLKLAKDFVRDIEAAHGIKGEDHGTR